jgi:hypothetical protein
MVTRTCTLVLTSGASCTSRVAGQELWHKEVCIYVDDRGTWSGAFVSGRAKKQLLIDGQWIPAASGKTFQSINPSTGNVIAHLAGRRQGRHRQGGGSGAEGFRRSLAQVHASSASERLAPAR